MKWFPIKTKCISELSPWIWSPRGVIGYFVVKSGTLDANKSISKGPQTVEMVWNTSVDRDHSTDSLNWRDAWSASVFWAPRI